MCLEKNSLLSNSNNTMLQQNIPMPSQKRLDSLDALRGFDLFILTMVGPVLHLMTQKGLLPKYISNAFSHVSWEGFNCWDMVMPLFLFMAGVSIPFAMSKYVGENAIGEKSQAYLRILKRVIVLWILGTIAQGNLLAFNINVFKPLTNTLQAIAIGYAGAAILFLHFKWKIQVTIAFLFLFVSWLLSIIFGDWNPNTNLPERIDEFLLGKWVDGARVGKNGEVVFANWYHYAWIFPSLNFIVTVLSGVFTGVILKSKINSNSRKFFILFVIGCVLVVFGWTLDLLGIAPVIKTIWTSSMVLVTSGYGMILMAVFFAIIDWAGFKKGFSWLKIIGMNSVLAYMLSPEVGLISFNSIIQPLFRGLAQFMEPAWFQTLIASGNAIVLLFILWLCKKAGLFLKA